MLAKKMIFAAMLFVAPYAWSAMCPVTVENSLLLTQSGEIKVEKQQDKLRIDSEGRVFVNGQELTLSEEQKLAVEKYQQQITNYVPAITEFADQKMANVNDFILEVETVLDNQGSFDAVKEKINQYGLSIKKNFYQGQDFIINHQFLNELSTTGSSNIQEMIKSLDKELFASVFNSLSAKMKNGELNFSELQQQYNEIQETLKVQIDKQSKEIKQHARGLCDSAKEIAEEENSLHQLIPELDGYPVFSI